MRVAGCGVRDKPGRWEGEKVRNCGSMVMGQTVEGTGSRRKRKKVERWELEKVGERRIPGEMIGR